MPDDPFLAFLDSRPEAGFPDLLTRSEDLVAFGVKRPDRRQLTEARELRDVLVQALLTELPDSQRHTGINALIERYRLEPRIGPDGAVTLISSAPTSIGDLAASMLQRVLQLHADGQLDRIKTCAADSCIVPFIDPSPTCRRRYCSDTCATRMRVRKHRRASKPGGGDQER